MQKGVKAVRAQFVDATAEINRRRESLPDPAPEAPRSVDGEEIMPGQWPGAPMDRLPPGCPVAPLGVDGKTCYFVDTLGQLMPVSAAEWNKKTLTVLFSQTPNFLYWAWPRFAAPSKKGGAPKINGLETDEAVACLVKAAGERGLFDPADKVRGRGSWLDQQGRLIWHNGEQLFTLERGRLQASRPGDLDGYFYPRRPPILAPWPEAIAEEESPAIDLMRALGTWTWERPVLDPLLVLGWIGAAFLGGALPWRPTVFLTGDKGRGKSTLQGIVKQVLGSALHATADTTAAGIYQRVKQDSLPVAVDELEGEADDKRAMAVIKLARLAASGGMMYRGGADHEGVEFRARNAFFFSSINPPPLEPADRSRMAILSLGKVDPARAAAAVLENPELLGRQMLRRLLDQWHDFDRCFADWRGTLRKAGFDGRGQDTYGVLLTVANLLLGDAGLERHGLPVTEQDQVGAMLAGWTQDERDAQQDNWRGCLDRLMSWTIDNWKGGDRPIVGQVAYDLCCTSKGEPDISRAMLAQAGLGIKQLSHDRFLIAVPPGGNGVEKIFAGTKWSRGTWMHALKQGPERIVIRTLGNGQNVRIAGQTKRCLLIDVKALHESEKEEE